MKKLLFLSILVVNLFSNDFKYFIEIDKNNNVEVIEINKEKFNKILTSKEIFKNDNKNFFWTYENKDYRLLDYYKKKISTPKKQVKEVKKEVIKISKDNQNDLVESESDFNFIGIVQVIVILMILVYFFYSQIKILTKSQKQKKVVKDVENVEIIDDKKSKKGDEKTSTHSKEDKEEIKEDNNINLMYYNELDEERKKLRKDFMDFKTNKNKKKIYRKFTKLNNDIKNKEDINILNKDFQLILKDIEGLKNE